MNMINEIKLWEQVTYQNFDESRYLASNVDVKKAVENGSFKSGYEHFKFFGEKEGRKIENIGFDFSRAKQRKLKLIKPLLKSDLKYVKTTNCYDFLNRELAEKYNIIDTDAVSSHSYDETVVELINSNQNGIILDFGAGKRPTYYDNVLNFEIVPYQTTDVRGVGEELPFKSNSFDGIICIAVLEHVKDPFSCAKEIARVLKPGGKLICSVPFLQPLHGYPHHYYNMTHQGLKNLFEDSLSIEEIFVPKSTLPIWSLTWILKSWSEGLIDSTIKKDFLNMKVGDLINSPVNYLQSPFVTELTKEKIFELSSAFTVICKK